MLVITVANSSKFIPVKNRKAFSLEAAIAAPSALLSLNRLIKGTSSICLIFLVAGRLTKEPTNTSCEAKGEVMFLDWRYNYTQPLQFIKWELLTFDGDVIETIGILNNETGSLVPDMKCMSWVSWTWPLNLSCVNQVVVNIFIFVLKSVWEKKVWTY